MPLTRECRVTPSACAARLTRPRGAGVEHVRRACSWTSTQVRKPSRPVKTLVEVRELAPEPDLSCVPPLLMKREELDYRDVSARDFVLESPAVVCRTLPVLRSVDLWAMIG